MADLTDKPSVITQAIVDLLKGDWDGIGCTSPDDIYYGDIQKVPRFPSVTVEPGSTPRDLYQTGLQERIEFTVYLMVYLGRLTDVASNKKETDQISEGIVERLHTDRRLGGLVIHGSPVLVEPGFAARGGSLLVTHRITWTGLSNHTMP